MYVHAIASDDERPWRLNLARAPMCRWGSLILGYNGGAIAFDGDFDDYRAQLRMPKVEKAEVPKPNRKKVEADLRNLRRPLESRMKKIEAAIKSLAGQMLGTTTHGPIIDDNGATAALQIDNCARCPTLYICATANLQRIFAPALDTLRYKKRF